MKVPNLGPRPKTKAPAAARLDQGVQDNADGRVERGDDEEAQEAAGHRQPRPAQDRGQSRPNDQMHAGSEESQAEECGRRVEKGGQHN